MVGIAHPTELIFAKPDLGGVLGGFIPQVEVVRNPEVLYIAIGILGATIMPHNYSQSQIAVNRWRSLPEVIGHLPNLRWRCPAKA